MLGPARSGKTTLLAAWAQRSTDRVIRLDLAEECDDFRRSSLYRDLGLGDSGQPNLDEICDALGATPTLVLADNAQALTHPTWLVAASAILRNLPPNLVVVVAGRTLPPLGWARLRLDRVLYEVGPHELASLTRSSTSLVDPDIAMLTDGWAGGVRLLTDAGRADPDLLKEPLSDAVADVLDEAGRGQLSAAALIGPCTARTLNAVTGRDDSATLISKLKGQPLPMVSVSTDREPWLGVSGALRTILIDDLRANAPETFEATLVAAAIRAPSEGDDDAAFAALRLLGDRRRMAHFVYLRSAHLALQGRPERSLEWLQEFSSAEIQLDAGLQLAMAIAAASNGDLAPIDRWLTQVALHPDDPRLPWKQGRGHFAVAPAGKVLDDFDPERAPWDMLGLALRAGIELNAGRLTEAEGVLNVMESLAGDYLLLDAFRSVLQVYIFLLTGRLSRAQAVVAATGAKLSEAGLLQHPWMLLWDVAALRCATKADDSSAVIERLTSVERKLVGLSGGMDVVLGHSHVAVAAAAVTVGRQTTMARHLALAEPLLTMVPEDGPLRAEFNALKARLAGQASASDAGLTPAETRVLRALAGHETVPQIADKLFLGVATVRSHIRSLHRKLGTHGREETIEAGRRQGLIT